MVYSNYFYNFSYSRKICFFFKMVTCDSDDDSDFDMVLVNSIEPTKMTDGDEEKKRKKKKKHKKKSKKRRRHHSSSSSSSWSSSASTSSSSSSRSSSNKVKSHKRPSVAQLFAVSHFHCLTDFYLISLRLFC